MNLRSALERKRKKTLQKKSHELARLCDVPVCMIYYDRNGNLTSYPEDKKEVTDILMRYKEHTGKRKIENHEIVNKKYKRSMAEGEGCEEFETTLHPIGLEESGWKGKGGGSYVIDDNDDDQEIGRSSAVTELDLVSSLGTDSCSVSDKEEEMGGSSSSCGSSSRKTNNDDDNSLGMEIENNNLRTLQLFN